ncbi:MAG: hypothetical protein JO161_00860 [Planctomycetaceae bacterium]|nr:hypothetical protein [Planctomycetaceae bacterium]
MVEEAVHGPRRGERLRRARQGGQPRHGGVDGVRVLTHELPEPILVAAIQAAKMESILTKITKSQNCVHTYALRAARYPFLMPVVCHGRSPKQPGGPSGSYVFRAWKRSGWSRYTLTEAKTGRTATVSICVKCRNYRGEHKRHGRQALIYAYWGYQPPSPDSVFTAYRLRFGIESSYRQLHEGRIRTTTRRPVVRLLYVGIALVLRNLWVWLHYVVLSMPRRGGRVILLERLRWDTLLLWLLHVVEETYGVDDTAYTERNVEYELAV